MDAAQDSMLFGMPEDPEMFLAALATVQDFVKQTKRQVEEGRKWKDWFMAVYIPNRNLEFLKPCFPEEVAFVDDWEPRRGDWDLVHKFDSETAYRLSLPTELHVTTAFGIMIGAVPEELSDLSAIKEETDSGILVIRWDDSAEQLEELVELHRPECQVGALPKDQANNEPLKYFCSSLRNYDVVVGQRSAMTYLAAAMGKVVLELYPDDRHPKWLSKWSGKYQQIYGGSFPVPLVFRGLEGVLDQYLQRV